MFWVFFHISGLAEAKVFKYYTHVRRIMTNYFQMGTVRS